MPCPSTRRPIRATLLALAAAAAALEPAAAAEAATAGEWARTLATANREYGTAVAVDAEGASYVTGFFLGELPGDDGQAPPASAGDSDVLLVKLAPAGEIAWARRIGGAGADEGRGVAVGPEGDIYLTGFFSETVDFDPGPGTSELTSAGSADVFVARFDSRGGLVWAKRAGGRFGDVGNDLAVGAGGRVYVTGYFQGEVDLGPGEAERKLRSAGGLDAFWLSLDANGGYLSAGRFGGKQADEGRAIAAGDEGATVCGLFRATAGWPGGPPWHSRGGSDAFVLRIDSAGAASGLLQLGGPLTDACAGLASSSGGGVLATGNFAGEVELGEGAAAHTLVSEGPSDAFVVSLDAGGELRWARRLGEAGSDFGFAVAAQDDGSAWAAGFHQPVPGRGRSGGETRTYLVRLDAAGDPGARRLLTAGRGVQALDLALGPAGAPHLVAVFSGDAVEVPLSAGALRLDGAGKIDILVARLPLE